MFKRSQTSSTKWNRRISMLRANVQRQSQSGPTASTSFKYLFQMLDFNYFYDKLQCMKKTYIVVTGNQVLILEPSGTFENSARLSNIKVYKFSNKCFDNILYYKQLSYMTKYNKTTNCPCEWILKERNVMLFQHLGHCGALQVTNIWQYFQEFSKLIMKKIKLLHYSLMNSFNITHRYWHSRQLLCQVSNLT